MSLNNVSLMGRICQEPEIKTTNSGISVTNFNIAVDRKRQPQGEDRITDFIPIVAWRNTAEFICRYFNKGSMIAVEGEIQTRNYEDKNGNKRTAFEVVASNVSFCGSKNEGGSTAPATYIPEAYTTPPQFEEISEDEEMPF